MTQATIPTPIPPPQRMTYEEFLDLPEQEGVIAEWEHGEVTFASVNRSHNRGGRFLLKLVSEYVEIQGLGELFYEPFQMKTGANLPGRSPDIMVLL